jgi:hypothetical protein
MRLTPLKIFAAAAVLSAVGAAAVTRAAGDKALAQLAGYREWARVTREPLRSEQPFAGG